MRGFPQFSFWILVALAKICFFRIVTNRAKTVLVGKFLYPKTNISKFHLESVVEEPLCGSAPANSNLFIIYFKYPEMRRTYAQ